MSTIASEVQILIENSLLENLVAVDNGDQLCREFVVKNDSTTTAATNVVATIIIPAGLTFVSATPSAGGGTYDSVLHKWNIGGLATETSVTLDLCVTVDDSCTLPTTIQATITYGGCDADTSDDTVKKLYAGMACCEIVKCVKELKYEIPAGAFTTSTLPTDAEAKTWADNVANVPADERLRGPVFTYFIAGQGGSDTAPDYVWKYNDDGTGTDTAVFTRVYSRDNIASNVRYVSKRGNNATAIVGSREYPYADPWAARTAAADGDTIHIFAGTYTVRDTGGDVNVGAVGDATFYKDGDILTYFAEPGVTIDVNATIEAPLFYDSVGGNEVRFYGKATLFQDGVNTYEMIATDGDDSKLILEVDKIDNIGFGIRNTGSWAVLDVKAREIDFSNSTREFFQNGGFDGSTLAERGHISYKVGRAIGLDSFEDINYINYNIDYRIDEIFFDDSIHTVTTAFPGYDLTVLTDSYANYSFGIVDTSRSGTPGYAMFNDILGTLTRSTYKCHIDMAHFEDYSLDTLIHPTMVDSTIIISRGLSRLTNVLAARNDANLTFRPYENVIDDDSMVIVTGTFENDTNGNIILSHNNVDLSAGGLNKGIVLKDVVLKSGTTESIACRIGDQWGANEAPATIDPIVIIASAVSNVAEQTNVGIQGNLLATAPQL